MIYIPDDPSTWPDSDARQPLIIAHDVGRSRDRSTAVVGGQCPTQPRVVGIRHLEELPLGLYGSARASALAVVDRSYQGNAIIVADLSNDPTYAEVLCETFGRRVIGLQIGRSGDGMECERRPVKHSAISVYNVGRSYLLELFHAELQAGQVRFVDGPESRRAFEQLTSLETELRESGTIYKCPSGQHDDLGMSCAMLAWAARHPHLEWWIRPVLDARRPARRRSDYGWKSFT